MTSATSGFLNPELAISTFNNINSSSSDASHRWHSYTQANPGLSPGNLKAQPGQLELKPKNIFNELLLFLQIFNDAYRSYIYYIYAITYH